MSDLKANICLLESLNKIFDKITPATNPTKEKKDKTKKCTITQKASIKKGPQDTFEKEKYLQTKNFPKKGFDVNLCKISKKN